jgi:NAD(P)-dependent dehydrogenase (short-subunit alcohol dehydrogenase family)
LFQFKEKKTVMDLKNPYDLNGQVAVITGGAGILCSTLARGLSACGACIAILDINLTAAERVAGSLQECGGKATAVQVDVLDKASIEQAAKQVINEFGRVDILINGAGGNKKEATTTEEATFFDLPVQAIRCVFELNFLGTLLPCQVFGRYMVRQGAGNIINISSMSAYRPLTNTVAYSAAKAAVSNFTQWLAVHISQNYSANVRVNAIAPGFFLTDQNRFLVTQEGTGELTPRGQAIVSHTPMGRLGDPEDLVGTVLWLISDVSSFVHGTVIPIDGAFSAYSGV